MALNPKAKARPGLGKSPKAQKSPIKPLGSMSKARPSAKAMQHASANASFKRGIAKPQLGKPGDSKKMTASILPVRSGGASGPVMSKFGASSPMKAGVAPGPSKLSASPKPLGVLSGSGAPRLGASGPISNPTSGVKFSSGAPKKVSR